jgi:hypothetical protein
MGKCLGVVIFALLAALPGLAAAQSAGPSDLAERAAAALRQGLPGYDVTIVDPLTLKVGKPGEEPGQVNLDRIAAFCADNKSDCEEVFSGYLVKLIQSVKEMDATPTAAALRVVVRRADFLAVIREQTGGEPENEPVGMAIADGNLVMVCEFDLPNSTRVVMTSDLKELGLSFEQAIARCRDNTRAALPSLESQAKLLEGTPFTYLDGDGYTSSHFLFHEEWDKLAKGLNGHLIAAVPSDNMILYGEETGASVDILSQLARKLSPAGERPISTQVFRWTAKGWEVAAP